MLSFYSPTYVISSRRTSLARPVCGNVRAFCPKNPKWYQNPLFMLRKGTTTTPAVRDAQPPITTTFWESIRDHRIQGWRLQRQHRLKLKWIRVLLMFLRFFQLTWLDVGELSWNWLPKNHTQVQEEKENFVVTSWSLHETWSRAATAEKSTKKCDARAKLLSC